MGEVKRLGYAITGSHCTFRRSLDVLARLVDMGYSVVPIMSERAYSTDTRFFAASDFTSRVRELTGRDIIHTVRDAEPLGPKEPLDILVISPCTGNTLAKLAGGITDTAVTMAAKAHLRQDRPLVIALASNDALSQNLGSLSRLLTRRSVYFVPMRQDDPKGKPHSLVAEIELVPECVALSLRGEQKRPLFL